MSQQYKRIFAALDGGSTQRTVAERAISIAEYTGADISCVPGIASVHYYANGVDFAALCEAGAERISIELADILDDARANPHVGSVDLKVAAGRINEALAEQLVEPYGPDLVICGERGLSNIRYAFVGSVSTFLIRNMDCDVLVLKQR